MRFKKSTNLSKTFWQIIDSETTNKKLIYFGCIKLDVLSKRVGPRQQ